MTILNEFQRYIKNLFFMGGSSIINNLINIIFISHLSDVFGTKVFGTYSFITTYVSYFLLITSLGTDITAIREIAVDKSRAKEILGALIPIKFFLSLLAFSFILLSMIFFSKIEQYGWTLAIFAIPLLFSPLNSVNVVFEGFKRLEFFSLLQTFLGVINLLAVLFIIKSPEDLNNLGYITVLIALANSLILNAMYISLYGKYSLNYDKKLLKELISKGIGIGLMQVTIMLIHYLDIFMLGFMKDDTQVGLYSAAYKIMFAILSMLSIFNNIISPILFENFKKNKAMFQIYFDKYFKFLIYFGYMITMIAVTMSTRLIDFFYNLDKYYESIHCFQILILSMLVMTINSPMNTGLFSAGKEKLLSKIIGFMVLINFIANALLIPDYGINGSAFATVITEVLGLFIHYYFLNKIINVKILRNTITAIISSTIAGSILYFLIDLQFIFEAIIGAVIMALLVFFFKGYTIKELREYYSLLINRNKT